LSDKVKFKSRDSFRIPHSPQKYGCKKRVVQTAKIADIALNRNVLQMTHWCSRVITKIQPLPAFGQPVGNDFGRNYPLKERYRTSGRVGFEQRDSAVISINRAVSTCGFRRVEAGFVGTVVEDKLVYIWGALRL
jgi:hypothetical protein